jgi:hypothetical protein
MRKTVGAIQLVGSQSVKRRLEVGVKWPPACELSVVSLELSSAQEAVKRWRFSYGVLTSGKRKLKNG